MSNKLKKAHKELLKSITDATNGDAGYLMVEQNDDLKTLVDGGHVEVNTELVQDGKIAARAASAPAAAANEAAPAAAAASGVTYELMSGIPLAPPKRGGKKEEEYPFSKMEVGQSFVVPATEKYPKPWETFASTVSSATRRFSVPDPSGKTRTDRNGKTVPVLVATKKFTLRQVTAGQKYENGFVEPATGARVFRIQ